jgi:hypothetical protein
MPAGVAWPAVVVDGGAAVVFGVDALVVAGVDALLAGADVLLDGAALIVKFPEQPVRATTSAPMPATPNMIRLIFTVIPGSDRFELCGFMRMDVCVA